jgi:hypothetical protein
MTKRVDGHNMTRIYDLVAKSVDAISTALREKEIIKLASGPRRYCPSVQSKSQDPTDFTLVTWLVIT